MVVPERLDMVVPDNEAGRPEVVVPEAVTGQRSSRMKTKRAGRRWSCWGRRPAAPEQLAFAAGSHHYC